MGVLDRLGIVFNLFSKDNVALGVLGCAVEVMKFVILYFVVSFVPEEAVGLE